MAQDYTKVASDDLQAWWIGARRKLVRSGKYDDCLPRLDKTIESGLCVVFLCDMAKTWVMFSPAEGCLWLEFLWSEKAGFIGRCMPYLLDVMAIGGYSRCMTKAYTKAHRRLYARYFTALGKDIFLLSGE